MTRVLPEISLPIVDNLAENGIAIPWKFIKQEDIEHYANRRDFRAFAGGIFLWDVFHYLLFNSKDYHPQLCICHSINDEQPLRSAVYLRLRGVT
jgi:hypothetical protein